MTTPRERREKIEADRQNAAERWAKQADLGDNLEGELHRVAPTEAEEYFGEQSRRRKRGNR